MVEPTNLASTPAPAGPVDVAAGADRLLCETGTFLVTRALYPPTARLPLHFHELPSIVIALQGVCVSEIDGRRFEMVAGDVVVEPGGQVHRNSFGSPSSQVVIFQPRRPSASALAGCEHFLSVPSHHRLPEFPGIARALHHELATPDGLTGLALEASAFQLIASAARRERPAARSSLTAVIDYIDAHFLHPMTLQDLAQVAGLHPAHLTREFRRFFATSPIAYGRRRRIEWAASQLLESDRSIGQIAADAGFADQSHFTRVFSSLMKISPARYRVALSSTPSAARE